ncbi:K(+)-transporting ATPase subunit F [Sphingobacterium sp. InxBP1]|nr:K(+)-transporting ATPase subunit F [Sphingobacterium sp. InxBP1]
MKLCCTAGKSGIYQLQIKHCLNKTRFMIALFIIAVGVFAYICYVLLRPEKF